ncbi:MAG: hypothetical protein R3F39_15325 [Myxococcota bacterium]
MADSAQEWAQQPAPVADTDAAQGGGETSGRKKALIGDAEGYDAQTAAMAPPEPAQDAAHDAANEPVDIYEGPDDEPEQAGPEALTPIREAMLKQFQILEGKGIGDAEYEQVCSLASWNKLKASEAEAVRYNKEDYPAIIAAWQAEHGAKAAADEAYRKAHPRPFKKSEAKTTTCIAAQGVILKAALAATNMEIKPLPGQKDDPASFGPMARIEAKKRNAWVESKVGITQRPQVGDLLYLEMRGGEDKVQEQIDGENSAFSLYGMSQKRLEQQLAQATEAAKNASEAKAAAAAANVANIEGKIATLQAQHEARIQVLQKKLDEARVQTAARAGTEVEINAVQRRRGGLAFSHIGMFKSCSPELDANGVPTGREIWETFDGGQNVPGKVDDEGAKSNRRLYDPRTNEFSGAKAGPGGVMTQDGKTRWLGGWVNLDELATPKE